MAGTLNRLSKVAREFNIGIHTIVDFLQEAGLEIESNPNTKLSEEAYELLVQEFQSEKSAKEESTNVKKSRMELLEDDSSDQRIEEEVLIKNVQGSVEDLIAEQHKDEPEVEKPKTEKKEKAAEEKPAKKEVVSEKETEKKVEGKDLKVIRKIDLDALNQKTKPDKKAKKDADKEPSEKVTEKKDVPKKDVEKPVEAEAEPQVEDAPERVIEEIKTQYKNLEGPKVLGKIVLPVKAPPKKKIPVASSSEEVETERKKRKRRKRVSSAEGSTDTVETGKKKTMRSIPGKPEVTEKDIQNQIKDTLARLTGTGKSKSVKHRRSKREAASEQAQKDQEERLEQETILRVTEFVTANELATLMGVNVNEVISACMTLGMFVSINQRLDAETLSIVAEEFGFKVQFVSAEVQEGILEQEDSEEDLVERHPIVTVMGHVDHGKTSLLDYIRKANVIAGEAGGITQHIGAYMVELGDGKKITFLDTPGHEAFTAMRARGAQVTDVVIVVVAADDNVMPQTKEAINHAQAAGVPIIIAINKIDRPNANPDKVKEALSAIGILVEDWGGNIQSQEVSAKMGTNVQELLDKVLLQSELLELKANPNKNGVGTVIESSLDKGRGYVTTILVQSGTVKMGDVILSGPYSGKIKAMFNERGQNIKEAGPSVPVSILGLNGAPNAGDRFNIMDDEREAKNIAVKRGQLQREQGVKTQKHITLDEIGRRIAIGDFKELNVIIKGDVDGSIEALADSLLNLSTEQIQVNVIHKSVGQISENDVMLAAASDAIIIGFQVRPSISARKVAEREEIDIRLYSIIYDAIDEIKAAMEGMLAPKVEEKIVGSAEIRDVFKITKVGTIAGCMVKEGKINRNNGVRVIREGIVVFTGTLGSLKRFKDDVKEVLTGYECGLNVDKFNDIKVGDVIESYEEVEVKQKLG
ncbi:MAG TPA: translation initiation factor IF-2 [Flavobacteriales bacterium]|nr:translation initiation factor IF-2 [Flavobacteriales bacterium]